MPRIFILDAMNLAYRAYHAIRTRRAKTDDELRADQDEEDRLAAEEGRSPKRVDPFRWEPLKNRHGEATNAVFGLANTILKIKREERFDYWALAWDGPGPTERHRMYEEYKATRKPTPPDMSSQLPAIRAMARAIGLPILEIPGQEADDVMATLARRGDVDGFEVVLVTSDKDMLQLVNEHVKMYGPAGRTDEYVWMDRAAVEAKWGVPPEQIRDVLALMGDSIDNVPGIPGVGEKTAVDLVRRFGSIDGIYERIAEVEKPSLKKKLEEHRERVYVSRDLVTVRTDCELPVAWDDLRIGPVLRDELLELARRYELKRLERAALDEGVAIEQAGLVSTRRGSGGARGTGRAAADESPQGVNPSTVIETERFDEEVPDLWAAARQVSWPDPEAEAKAGVWVDDPRVDPELEAAPPEPETLESDEMPVATRRGPMVQGSLELFVPAAGEATPESIEARLHAVRARSLHGIAILPVISYDESRQERLVGIGLAARDGTVTYVPLAHTTGPNLASAAAREWLGPMLADPLTPKVGHDLKRDLHVLERAGYTLQGLEFDLHLGSFLLDPSREHSLEALARDVLGEALPTDASPGAKTRGRTPVESQPVAETAARIERCVAAMVPLAEALRAQLEAREQWRLYTDLEHPLIPVLAEMEDTGIQLDRAVLSDMAARAGAEIERLEAELYALAGEPLNLNSGPQLSKVLFEKLGLKATRRTKTGFSTDQAVLEELAPRHPFPALLLEYRALTKLKSTYLDALPSVVDPRDGRIHTTYHQAGAATGRLSSSDPNLQNIPMRSPQGREIRRAFVARPGHVLVGADYSQIELRVMAHLSGDPNLIEAFSRDEDVHASTARKIFGLGEQVPVELRSRAKIVNFGIMYGMGARSLSSQMGIGLTEAQEFIRNYFRVFARVRETLDRLMAEARRRGYAETLFGRRLYLPNLTSAHGGERSMAERVSINMPIQGSAADLMKLAMIRVHAALKASAPSARLLLQVHDELLLECPAEQAEHVARVARAEMEGCVPLRVPLAVSVGQGPTWFDVH